MSLWFSVETVWLSRYTRETRKLGVMGNYYCTLSNQSTQDQLLAII